MNIEIKDKKFLDYLRGNSYRSEIYNLFYVATPKVACTSLKWWFAALEGKTQLLHDTTDIAESDPDLDIHQAFHKVAPNVTGLNPEILSEVLTSESYFRFAVVRNPYRRIFSAWQSKLLLQEPLQIGPYLQCDFFRLPINGKGDVAMAFEGFLEHLAKNEAPSYWDYHWTPQSVLLRPDLIKYTRLAKIEEVDELSNELTDRLGASIPNPFACRRTNESLIPYLPELVTERSAQLISSLYVEDFDTFGYDKEPPKARETFSDVQFDLALKAISLIRGRHRRMGERNDQIANLSHTVSERNDQIANLSHAVADRDGQITSLSHAVADRDGQITSLSHAVADRDVQITNLRDKIACIVNDCDRVKQERNQILSSRSWRVTMPLRKVAGTVRQGVCSPRMLFLKKIVEYLRIRRDAFGGSAIRELGDSPLFNAEYYLANNPDLQRGGVDPARHYLLHGWKEHRDPSADFSTSEYLRDNPDIDRGRINPLLHYLRHGRQEGRSIGRSAISEITENSVSAHPSGSSQDFVAAKAPPAINDQGKTFHAVIDQEMITKEVEAIRRSGLFDEPFYRTMYPDIQPPPQDPIRHYCEYGWREGKKPSDDFDTLFYLATYSDIRNAKINPFWHYVVAGASEMRHALPDLATRYEDDIWFGVVESDIKLLAFYAAPDWETLRRVRPMFRGHAQAALPHEELGLYDCADMRVLKQQVELAKRHGLYGFCFDLGLETAGSVIVPPLEYFLEQEDIDFRFCVQAELPEEEALAPLVASLCRALADRRFICIHDRPVILLALTGDKEKAIPALRLLRHRLVDQGVVNPFLIVRTEEGSDASLSDLCDALLKFPLAPIPGETGDFLPLDKNGVDVVPYSVIVSQGVSKIQMTSVTSSSCYHAVTLGRDNTALNPERPLVYTRFHLRDYRRWLDTAFSGARLAHPDDRRFVFVNGWNDWNGGLFLEPDRQGGFSRVNETTRALLNIAPGVAMPKVSVIVPNYNHEPFLRRRLDSIYGQTYKNIEVILLDDCSSDQSRSLMDEYAAAYPDVTRTLYNERNSGSAFRQWAKGIKAATGDLVWIAESDDYCDERFLEVLLRSFDDEAVLLAYAKSIFVDKNEVPIQDDFKSYVCDLECAEKWDSSYVETAHNEVRSALGIKNTIPNASSVLFKRPIEMPLLDDETWLSMVVAGDWVFYLHIIRGGKISYNSGATNFFRRYEGSTAEATYKKNVYYREVSLASRTVAALYDVPLATLEKCRQGYRTYYEERVGKSVEDFDLWYDYESILFAREKRLPNVLISTMGFFPGGAEILPIRLANEFKRQGLSVLLLNAGLNPREDGVRRMLRNDVPLIETSSVEDVKAIIRDFGVEVLNTHQWHIQKYPLQVPDVFGQLRGHVASLHGMIEHGDAFGVTRDQLRKADQNVTTWIYTAEKNIGPFSNFGLYDKSSPRFVKMPNGMQPPRVVPVPREEIGLPEDAFVLCCVSRAIPDKGWAETISVVERARELSGRDIRLILVGNGPVYDEYCRTGVPGFVYLAGFSENSVGHYAAADMGVMLTKFKSESFPLTIVDCLFAGKPYISSDVGDIRNMLTSGDDVAGAVIELADWEIPVERAAEVVAAFATDKERYLSALALVPGVAHRYRIDVVASQYVSLFESSRNEGRLSSRKRRNWFF